MKRDKRTRKQVAKGTPATQPPTTRPDQPTHPEHTSDGAAEKKKPEARTTRAVRTVRAMNIPPHGKIILL